MPTIVGHIPGYMVEKIFNHPLQVSLNTTVQFSMFSEVFISVTSI